MPELDLVIAGGRVVTPWGTRPFDLGIEGGVIRELADSPSRLVARRRVEAEGRLVLPGAIDPHVHFENPSMGTSTAHDFGLGTEAAALGGTTTVIDFAFQQPGETPLETIRKRKAAADPKVVIDYGLHGCITRTDRRSLDDVPAMAAFGCPSTKVFMVYRDEGWMVDDGAFVEIMRLMDACGGTLLVHAENEGLLQWGIKDRIELKDLGPGGHARSRPPLVEAEAIRRTAYFALMTGCPLYVVHMSTGAGLEQVRRAKREGAPVFSETCAHYLALDASILDSAHGERYVMSPPLRSPADQAALWGGLADGSIEGLGSDDAAYFEEYKTRGVKDFRRIANGIPGVQVRVPYVFSEGVLKGRLTLERFTDAVATQPARLFGLYPRKGVLAPGSDADLVIYDEGVRWRPTTENMRTNIEYTCYEHLEIVGRPLHVFSRGEQVVESGHFVGRRGAGRFIERRTRTKES